jgi:4-hydroxybenzoate polyprenyltransferase
VSGVQKLRTYGGVVTIAHTVFALPFAATAVVLSLAQCHLPLSATRALAMLACMVCARTSAMAFNRWADRDVDARNPRTRGRHLVTGAVGPREVLGLCIVSAAGFVVGAAALGAWPLVLSPAVLAVLLGYSYAKRFTWAAHLWLGVALSLAPGGAWIAMGATPSLGIALLMGAVVAWLFGFDVLYSLQDEEFDRQTGLHSVPARFGTRRALLLSELAHVVSFGALGACGCAMRRGGVYFVGVAVVGVLLVYEHVLVRCKGLAVIGRAFFDVNAWVSVAFFAFATMDELVRR